MTIAHIDNTRAAETLRDIADRIEHGKISGYVIGFVDGESVKAALSGQYLQLVGVNELVKSELLKRIAGA